MSSVTITFDGRSLQARAGQTVAAALAGAGVRSWRTTRHHSRPRGLFCGIGICFDCLVTVDDRPGQRACLVPVRDGMTVNTTTDRNREGDDD